MKKIFSVFVIAYWSITALTAQALPKANVVDINNEVIEISDYVADGNPKIISLWATWCGPCRMELNALAKVSDGWKKNYGVDIIAVTIDVPSMVGRAKSMFEKNGWNYIFMHDTKGEFKDALGIKGIPYSILVDGNGKIVSTQSGYYPGYEKELESKIKALKK